MILNLEPLAQLTIIYVYVLMAILWTRLVFIDELYDGNMIGASWARVGTPEVSMPRVVLILFIAAALLPITIFSLLAGHAYKLKA